MKSRANTSGYVVSSHSLRVRRSRALLLAGASIAGLASASGAAAQSLTWVGDGITNPWDFSTTDWSNGSPVAYTDGSAVTFDQSGIANNTVNLNATVQPGNVVFNATGNYTLAGAGAISGTTSLSQLASGTVFITNSGGNNYSGGTLISAGAINVGNNTANGDLGSGAITNNANLFLNRNATYTVGNDISGTGTITINNGLLTLNGNNSNFLGQILITNSGANNPVTVGSNNALGASNSLGVVLGAASGNGNKLIMAPGVTVNTPLTMITTSSGSKASIDGDPTIAPTYAGPITILGIGQGQFNSGANPNVVGLTLSGPITSTGTNAGILLLRGVASAGGPGLISGHVNDPLGTVFSIGNWTVSSTGNNWHFTEVASGGTILNGANNAMATNSTLEFGQFNAATGGIYEMNGFNQQFAAIIPTAGIKATTDLSTFKINNKAANISVLTINETANDVYPGQIAGPIQLVLAGTSTVTLSNPGAEVINGRNTTYTGSTLVQNGVLQAGALNTFSFNSAIVLGTATSTAILDINGSNQTVASLAGSAGSLTALGGATLTVGGDNSSTEYAGSITDAGGASTGTGGTLLKQGSGTMQLSNPSGLVIPNVNVTAGNVSVGTTANGVTGPLNIPGNLTVGDSASLVFLPSTGSAVTHSINSVNLSSQGKLDIGNSSFLTSSSASTVQQYLAEGYNGGHWNGSSSAAIVSSSAASAFGSGNDRSLGYASSTDHVAGSVVIPAGQTLVKYTTPGDADLSGTTDFNDFLALQNNYNQPGNWTQGDWNYSGTVDFNDYLILQNNYNHKLNANGSAAGSAKTAASKLTASGSVSGPATVTYVLVKNDDGTGHFAAGSFAVYAVDTMADGNQGLAAYELDVKGFSTISNFAPAATYFSGGKALGEGFSSLRSADTGEDPVKGSQDTTDANVKRIVYGFGQTAGSLDSGSLGSTQPDYGAPLLLATGTFTDPNALLFNSDNTFDQSNVFLANTGTATEAATITLQTQTLSGVPEPTSLGLIALAAGGMLARRRRGTRYRLEPCL